LTEKQKGKVWGETIAKFDADRPIITPADDIRNKIFRHAGVGVNNRY